MIEVVSYPTNLGIGDSRSKPYLELYGETTPLLCQDHLETPVDGNSRTFMAIYEYFWTLGIPEEALSQLDNNWFHQDDPCAEVWLLFPRTGGWRVCEVVAAIRYLRPLPEKQNLMTKVAAYWKSAAPILDEVVSLSRLAQGLSPVIPQLAPTAPLINMLAKLPITSLPPVEGFRWSVDKVTKYVGSEAMEGVHWKLPQTLFTELEGNRINGSLTVYFHASRLQQSDGASGSDSEIQERPILARSVVHTQKCSPYVPENGQDETIEESYIRLKILPCQRPS